MSSDFSSRTSQIEVMDDIPVPILRQLSTAQKLGTVSEMFGFAHEMIRCRVRTDHPTGLDAGPGARRMG